MYCQANIKSPVSEPLALNTFCGITDIAPSVNEELEAIGRVYTLPDDISCPLNSPDVNWDTLAAPGDNKSSVIALINNPLSFTVDKYLVPLPLTYDDAKLPDDDSLFIMYFWISDLLADINNDPATSIDALTALMSGLTSILSPLDRNP